MVKIITLFTIAHALAGAAWFGAMFYSLTVLQPRAILFFDNDEKFETFITVISHGARWKVLGAFGLMAITGIPLTAFNWSIKSSTIWFGLVGIKSGLFLITLVIFVYTSWWLWPARVLATVEEMPSMQRKFKWVGGTLLALVGLNIAIGIVANTF